MSSWPIQAGTQIRKNRIGFLLAHVSKDAIAFFLHLKRVLTWTESLAFRAVGVPGDSVIGVTHWPCAHCGWPSPQHVGPQGAGRRGAGRTAKPSGKEQGKPAPSASSLCTAHSIVPSDSKSKAQGQRYSYEASQACQGEHSMKDRVS